MVMNKYTPEDLLLYLYNECSSEQAAAIENELQKDWSLREKLAVLQSSRERLNSLVETPRTEAVLSVLRYAAKTETVLPGYR